MKPLILGLYGISNSGKSTTLNKLIDVLKENSELCYLSDNTFSLDTNDKVALFQANDVLIGISTAGDDAETISRRVENFLIQEKNCQIIVTASHVKDKSAKIVEEIAKRNTSYDLKWIDKLYHRNDDIVSNVSNIDNQIYFESLAELQANYLAKFLIQYLPNKKEF